MAEPSITEADILREVVCPDAGDMSPQAAQSILDLKFKDRATERMRVLLDLNSEGEISESEAAELDKWRRVGLFLDLMQSKARRSLNTSQS